MHTLLLKVGKHDIIVCRMSVLLANCAVGHSDRDCCHGCCLGPSHVSFNGMEVSDVA